MSEVAIDTLTGESRVLKVDILHDVGQSINPALDIGQIEGGFVQGMGWLTTEQLVWKADGALAISVFEALRDAVAQAGGEPQAMIAPATAEEVLRSVSPLRE